MLTVMRMTDAVPVQESSTFVQAPEWLDPTPTTSLPLSLSVSSLCPGCMSTFPAPLCKARVLFIVRPDPKKYVGQRRWVWTKSVKLSFFFLFFLLFFLFFSFSFLVFQDVGSFFLPPFDLTINTNFHCCLQRYRFIFIRRDLFCNIRWLEMVSKCRVLSQWSSKRSTGGVQSVTTSLGGHTKTMSSILGANLISTRARSVRPFAQGSSRSSVHKFDLLGREEHRLDRCVRSIPVCNILY